MPIKLPNVKCEFLGGKEITSTSGKYWYCNLKQKTICPGIPSEYLCLECKDVREKDMEINYENIRKALAVIMS